MAKHAQDTDQSDKRDNCLETYTVHLFASWQKQRCPIALQNGAIGANEFFVQCRELSWPISPISKLPPEWINLHYSDQHLICEILELGPISICQHAWFHKSINFFWHRYEQF